MITITDAAVTKIKGFIETNPSTPPYESVLRITIQGGGCAGYTPVLNIESADETELQKAKLINGIYVVIDPKSALFLANATLNYIDGLMQSAFSFDIPGSHQCGCGNSYGV